MDVERGEEAGKKRKQERFGTIHLFVCSESSSFPIHLSSNSATGDVTEVTFVHAVCRSFPR